MGAKAMVRPRRASPGAGTAMSERLRLADGQVPARARRSCARWPRPAEMRVRAGGPQAEVQPLARAGALGVSSRSAHGVSEFSASFLAAHGGIAGELLYQLGHRLVQDVGVDILVVFMALAGVTLLTGASPVAVIRAFVAVAGGGTRLLRALSDRGLSARRLRRELLAGGPAEAPDPAIGELAPPEPD